jgi:cysteine desulfuration protein SufE
MASIEEISDEIIEEFDMFDNWMDKYEHIISMGKDLEEIDESQKLDDYLVKGCQSKVWLSAVVQDSKLYFKADSDAIITKGIIALLVRAMSGHSPQEVANTDLAFIEKIGLKEHLSPNRSNGLVSMVKKMKYYAIAHMTKMN